MSRKSPHTRHLRLLRDTPREEQAEDPDRMKDLTEIIPILGPKRPIAPYKNPTSISLEQHAPMLPWHIRALCGSVGALMRRRFGEPEGRSFKMDRRYVDLARDYMNSSHPCIGAGYHETDQNITVHLGPSVLVGNKARDRWQNRLVFHAPKLWAPDQPDPAAASRNMYYVPGGDDAAAYLHANETNPVTVYQARAAFTLLRSSVGFDAGVNPALRPIPEAEIPFAFENLNLPRLPQPTNDY